MMNPKNALASALLVLLSSCAAPVEGYFNSADQITESWSATMGSAVGGGNGAFMSLDGQTLAVISLNCAVNAYDPATGTEKWKYAPVDATLMCTGGLWFTGSSVYFSPDSATSSYVTALNIANGQEIFTTAPVEGLSAGTPVTSSDGKYVLITSNPSLGSGLFTVFDSADPSTPALTFPIAESRVSAIGAYWMPIEGHFVEGFGNANDAFYFGLDVSMDGANVTVGDGQMYAYQAGDAAVTLIGDVRTFQSGLPPVIANDGLNMYWSVARSQVRCWAGTADLKRTAFDVGSIGSVELERGNPAYLSAKAPPVVTAGETPMAYGPSAANEIYSLNFDCSVVSVYTFTEPSLVLSNKVLLSNDEMYLYAATPTGEVWFLDAANLEAGPTWTYPLTVPVEGELAISFDGLHIFVPDVNGLVHALKVSDVEHAKNVTALPPSPAVVPGGGTAPVAAPAPTPLVDGTIGPTMSQAPSSSASPSPGGDGTKAPAEEPTPTGGGGSPMAGPAPTGSSASAMAYFGALVLVALSMILV